MLLALPLAGCDASPAPDEPTSSSESALWGGWESLGTKAYSSIAVSHWGPGRLDFFYLGADAAMKHRWYAGGWSGEENLGGSFESSPAAIAWAPDRIDLVAVQTGGTLVHAWYSGGWHGWENLGRTSLPGAQPALTSPRAGELDVIYVAPDYRPRHFSYVGGWTADTTISGQLVTGVAAYGAPGGQIDLFATGAGNALVHSVFRPDGSVVVGPGRPWGLVPYWHAWESLGGYVSGNPSVTSWGDGKLHVVYVGRDLQLTHRYYQGGWSGEERLGGILGSSPSVTAWSPGRLDVFTTATSDRTIYHDWWNDGAGGEPAHLVEVQRLIQTGHHLYTADASEVASATASGWTREGAAFRCWNAEVPSSAALHRFFNPSNGDHYYNVSPSVPAGYLDEGVLCWVPTVSAPGMCGLSRYWKGADHLMTLSFTEGNYAFQCAGYHEDGYAGSSVFTPVYPPSGSTCETGAGADAVTYASTHVCPGTSSPTGGGGGGGGGGTSPLPTQCTPGVAMPGGCPLGQFCYMGFGGAVCGGCGGRDQICCPTSVGYLGRSCWGDAGDCTGGVPTATHAEGLCY